MLKVIKHNEPEKWNTIVESFLNHDIYYYFEHSKLYHIHEMGTPILFYFADETSRGIHVALIRDISEIDYFEGKIDENIYFDLITPYGYGGFLIEGNYTKESQTTLKNEYLDYCQKNNIISEFIKFHPLLGNHKYLAHIFDIESYGETAIMELGHREDIWSNYNSSNRRNIRKAKKSNVKIYWSNDPFLIFTFKEMYAQTMDRANASKFYYFSEKYYEYLTKSLNKNFMFFYAKKDQKIIAISIVFLSNKSMHYHLSASDEAYRNLYPTNYLIHEAAMWGSMHGFTKFHLGGGIGGKKDSLLKFKQKFTNSNRHQLYIGKKIYKQEIYEKLVALRSSTLNKKSTYFPLYRS